MDLYAIDNESTDRTTETLKQHDVPYHHIDTDGAFDVDVLQAECMKTARLLGYDWVVVAGADLYIVPKSGTLYEALDRADGTFFKSPVINFCNTNERLKGALPFIVNEHYQRSTARLITKLIDGVEMIGDQARGGDAVQCSESLWAFNYGNTKSAEQREETLARRVAYWNRGGHIQHGTHYLEGKRREWVWDRNKLSRINLINDHHYRHFRQMINEII